MWAAGQSESESDANRVSFAKATLEGCIDGAIGNYVLIDRAGASYRLAGNPEQLKAYVGDTVRVTGVVTPVSQTPGAMSEGTEMRPTLSIVSLQKLSSVCNDSNELP
jgi:hypothetical protein